jgi:hypothetical protein
MTTNKKKYGGTAHVSKRAQNRAAGKHNVPFVKVNQLPAPPDEVLLPEEVTQAPKKRGRPKKVNTEVTTEEEKKVGAALSLEIPKRYVSHNESFIAFLTEIHYEAVKNYWTHVSTSEFRAQRRWLYEIIESDFPGRTRKEIYHLTSWNQIDNQVRLLNGGQSSLSRSKREFLIQLFNHVDHFVAKDDEVITHTVDSNGNTIKL